MWRCKGLCFSAVVMCSKNQKRCLAKVRLNVELCLKVSSCAKFQLKCGVKPTSNTLGPHPVALMARQRKTLSFLF